MKNKILFIGSQCFNKQSQDFSCQKKRLFPAQFPGDQSMNMKKVLWRRIQQCLATISMLLVEVFSETSLFRHLSNQVFRVTNFRNAEAVRVNFFSKYSKLNVFFKNAAQNWENFFCFLDNSVWIVIVKLSLLRTRYFSSVANVLTRSPKIWHVNKRDFWEFSLPVTNEYDQGAVIHISTELLHIYHIVCRSILRNGTF